MDNTVIGRQNVIGRLLHKIKKKDGSDKNERKEKLKKLGAPIGGSSRLKSKRQTVKHMVTTKTQQLLFEFGWKHWSDRRFKQRK